jgi:superoxide dismutase, Cu-Zn family
MVMSACSRNAAAALGVLVVPVALLSACSSHQHPSSSPGTTPSVWSGSPPPPTAPTGSAEAAAPESLTTHLRSPSGTEVATAKFEFNTGYVTLTVQTVGGGQLTPGFHGLHIHSVGKCEANSVAPTGGPPGDFLSAGGHYRAPGHSGSPESGESGDLTSLQVRGDGQALLVTTTDAFTKEDLVSGAKTSIMIHAGPDNFANIPADRYRQANGAPGADQTTMSTGDAGKRVACGVIGTG